MKKPTVTIGIPAYNEGMNIKHLLDELFAQELHLVTLKEVVIVSDGSHDNTEEQVVGYPRREIQLIKNKINKGVAESQNQIIARATGDILVLLNADIVIPSSRVIDHLVAPILFGSAWMSAGQIIEQSPKTMVEYGLYGSMCMKRALFAYVGSGNSVYSCVGPIRAFSRKYYRQLKFIQNEGEDMYSYLLCKKLRGKFVGVQMAKVHYKLPSTTCDYQKQSDRFSFAIESMYRYFGKTFVRKEFAIQPCDYAVVLFGSLPTLILYFPHLLVYCYLLVKTRLYHTDLDDKSTWGVQSTKILQRAGV